MSSQCTLGKIASQNRIYQDSNMKLILQLSISLFGDRDTSAITFLFVLVPLFGHQFKLVNNRSNQMEKHVIDCVQALIPNLGMLLRISVVVKSQDNATKVLIPYTSPKIRCLFWIKLKLLNLESCSKDATY